MKKFFTKIRQIKKALGMELEEHRSSFIVYAVLRLLVIVVMVLQISVPFISKFRRGI